MQLLDKILDELVRIKCAPDADGDRPIQWVLVNRRTHFWPVRPTAMPYKPKLRDLFHLNVDATILIGYLGNYFSEEMTREARGGNNNG